MLWGIIHMQLSITIIIESPRFASIKRLPVCIRAFAEFSRPELAAE